MTMRPTPLVADALGGTGQQRPALLAAVQSELDRVGYRRIRVDDVARVAGVSRQTVYDYFGSRDGMLRSFIAEESIRLGDIIRAGVIAAHDPRLGLESGLRATLDWLAERPSLQDPLLPDFVTFAGTRGRTLLQYQADMAARAFSEVTTADATRCRDAGEVLARLLLSFLTQPPTSVPGIDDAAAPARERAAALIASSAWQALSP